MNSPFPLPDEDVYQPTPAELRMSQSINFLVSCLLRGELAGIAVCAVNNEDEDSCFYFNKESEPVLRGAMERLKVMYETNQSFRHMDNSPLHNKSYREH